MAGTDSVPLENRPGILMVGSSNVGKRTLLSRLLSVEFDDDTKSELFAHGWAIDTKYYTADVAIWMAHLSEELCVNNMPSYGNLAALVMVFDLNDLKSFDALRKWVGVGSVDLGKFDVLLCVGNKVDLVEGHTAHVEYKRRLMKKSEGLEDLGYGVVENEGRGLLQEEESGVDVGVGIEKLCVEWCVENGIEYVEACAANAEFDKCLSLDGDSQGVERLFGALSAHMWPGMVLKSGNGKVAEPYLPQGEEEVSDEDSEFEFDYEVLSEGSGEPWIDADEGWVSANGPVNGKSVDVHAGELSNGHQDDGSGCSGEREAPSASIPLVQEKSDGEEVEARDSDKDEEGDLGSHFEFEDLERLMSEIGGMRDSLRLMPDFQRREMAAKLALRMASMFGGESEDED
uniref:Uncharacterized protein n=1 Tax=Kalanchoe fedtschenkoi TaxID=63787 RepID=A0A7N0TDQ2_KALFE